MRKIGKKKHKTLHIKESYYRRITKISIIKMNIFSFFNNKPNFNNKPVSANSQPPYWPVLYTSLNAVFQSCRNAIKFIFEKVTPYFNNRILENFSTVYLCHY